MRGATIAVRDDEALHHEAPGVEAIDAVSLASPAKSFPAGRM